jgi:hypothetical protein
LASNLPSKFSQNGIADWTSADGWSYFDVGEEYVSGAVSGLMTSTAGRILGLLKAYG